MTRDRMLDPNPNEFTCAREREFLDIIEFDFILSFKLDDTRNAMTQRQFKILLSCGSRSIIGMLCAIDRTIHCNLIV